MRFIDYAYYCIYRFMLKTQTPVRAEAWAIVFIGWAPWMHLIPAYYVYARLGGMETVTGRVVKSVVLIGISVSVFLAFWHYVLRGHGDGVVRSFSKLRRDKVYSRIGLFMFVETLLFPAVVGGLLVAWEKWRR
jgi:hypothetical protein